MTTRFRYLPCALHEALTRPSWAMGHSVIDGPYRLLLAPSSEPDIRAIDLAHPAGWDHAVRALAGIKGIDVSESDSVAFCYHTPSGREHATALYRGIIIRPKWALRVGSTIVEVGQDDYVNGTANVRREALCRAICAALNLDPDVVFPVAETA